MLERSSKPLIHNSLEIFPAVAVMGARQTGKSTLVRAIAQERGMAYHTLDDNALLQEAQEDPTGFIREIGAEPCVLDEVQRAPKLWLALKAEIDRNGTTGRFLITGSSQAKIEQGVGDALLGRAEFRTLRPLTLGEQSLAARHGHWSTLFTTPAARLGVEIEALVAAATPFDWPTVTAAGGMPRAAAQESSARRKLLNAYVEAFVRRDVREVLGVEDVDRFERFFRILAANTGRVLDQTAIARDVVGVSARTISRWIEALDRAYMLTRIPAYSMNANSRLIKSPKLFLVDSALAMAAAQELDPSGLHFETMIANDILCWATAAPYRSVSHWRTSNGQEVDFVLTEEDTSIALEIKGTASPSASDTRHLAAFLEAHPEVQSAFLLSSSPEIKQWKPNVFGVPWWAAV
jgi:hypothetical protein